MAYRHPRDEIGSSLMNMASGLNTIQAMGQRNTKYQQQQGEYNRQQTFRSDTESNRKSLNDGTDMSGSMEIQDKAMSGQASNLQSKQSKNGRAHL